MNTNAENELGFFTECNTAPLIVFLAVEIT